MEARLEKEFLILCNNKRIHIPTLELLLEGGIPLVKQKGNSNVNIVIIGSKQIKIPKLKELLFKKSQKPKK